MKKISLILMTLILVISFTACQSKEADNNPPDTKPIENKNLEGDLQSILDI